MAGRLTAGSLSGRRAFVTGAGRGIGLAIAAALAGQGASVALVDVDSAALDRAVVSLDARALPLQVDVRQMAQIEQAVERTVEHFGGLDILVNNAGICPMTGFADISESEWDRVLEINLRGPFFCCQATLSHLRRSGRHGRIINIASAAAQMGGVAIGAHYAASKAGLIGLTKSLARMLAADGVTVNCVAPGTTATDLTAAWPEETRDGVRAQIPLGRFARPDEIAEAVCFLASDGAAFITGATIDINGGLYVR